MCKSFYFTLFSFLLFTVASLLLTELDSNSQNMERWKTNGNKSLKDKFAWNNFKKWVRGRVGVGWRLIEFVFEFVNLWKCLERLELGMTFENLLICPE